MLDAFCAGALLLLVRQKTAETRWMCIQPNLLLLFYVIMFGMVGPDAWLREYMSKQVAKQLEIEGKSVEELFCLSNDLAFQISKRLEGCTDTMNNHDLLMLICILNVALAPLDSFMLYTQKVDSEANHDAGGVPLTIQWFLDTNPIDVAQRELFKLTKADGDLCVVVERWWFAKGCSSSFFRDWTVRCMAVSVNQACAIKLKFEPR